jgi:hypothetical protein
MATQQMALDVPDVDADPLGDLDLDCAAEVESKYAAGALAASTCRCIGGPNLTERDDLLDVVVCLRCGRAAA